MSSLFSSPAKQAQQASDVATNAAEKTIGTPGPITVPQAGGAPVTVANTGTGLEGYVQQGQAAERAALAGLGPNPQYATAGTMSPSRYAVNPQNVVAFGGAPGGQPAPNAFAPQPGAQSGPPRRVPSAPVGNPNPRLV